jgi:hypothetical protein
MMRVHILAIAAGFLLPISAPETVNNGGVTGLPIRIPYSTEQGIILAEQGILAREQGILSVKIEFIAG